MIEKLTYEELENRVRKLKEKIEKHSVQNSDKKYRILFEKSKQPILIIENEKFVDCNQATLDILGYKSKKEFLNIHPSELSPKNQPDGKDSLQRAKAMMNIALKKGSHRFEWEHVKANKETFSVEVFLTTFSNRKGNQVIHTIWRDITEQKKAEDELKVAAAINKIIISESPIGISIYNKKGQCIDANNSLGEILGTTKEQILAQNYNEIESWKKFGLIKLAKDAIRERTTKRQEFQITSTFLQKKIVIDCHFVPFLKKGDINLMLMIADMTNRIKVENEKIVAQKIAAEHEKMALVGQLAGKMAHDFNNVLGVIMGNAELSLLDCTDDNIKKALELILKQTIRGKNLTKNLVAFAKDQELKQEFFRSNEKVDLVVNLLKKDLEGIEIIKDGKQGLPELLADPGMIEHGLVNLLQNSIHALSKVKNPKITIRTYKLDSNIYFEIEDNGCGIPKEYIDKIYEPSFTLKGNKDISGSYRNDIKGTGYGMANVKKYIGQHNGSITVESKFGSGTKFSIKIPITNKKLTNKEKIDIQKQIIQFEKYVLLVEDEPAISDVQYRVLTQEPCNHKVDVANNGRVAIDLIDRNKYDFVSLDYILPGDINGMDVYNHIRETYKDVPILFISGNIEFIESIKALKKKDTNIDHISKPCQNKDYVISINKLLENN